MGKLTEFRIVFGHEHNVFTAGNALEGEVMLELSRDMKIRGIRLNVEGFAKVAWSERHASGTGKNRRTVTRYYTANETYLDAEKSLILFDKGQGKGKDSYILTAGKYKYPFSVLIPPDCPTSFEGTYGRVRYCVLATIDKPWKFNHTISKIFTVLNLLDLNNEPKARQPLHAQSQKTLCCLCCESGPITAVFKLDRAGYVPGESIPIKAEVVNNSNRTMSDVSAELVMTLSYHATTKTRTRYDIVCTRYHGKLEAGETDCWNGDPLPIPALPPSYLRGCRLIDVQHIVRIRVDPSGPAVDLEVPLEVIIGSIPLSELSQKFSQLSYRTNAASNGTAADPEAPIVQQPSTSSPIQPTLRYGEFVLGRRKVDDGDDDELDGADRKFTPVYTYYDFKNVQENQNGLQTTRRHQAW